MVKAKNPFLLKGYDGPGNFCDRQQEISDLMNNIENGQDTTLFSIRRMGKTGLIHHLFHSLSKKKITCIYLDIYATQSLGEFTEELVKEVIRVFPEKKSIGKKFMEIIKSFNPVISYDPFTGSPEVRLAYNQEAQKESTLREIMTFLDSQSEPVVLAIDEFQQIVNYPEKNFEALLRTILQRLNNTRLIFSGSEKHLLVEIFNSAKRPFFSSTSPLYLAEIPQQLYMKFIKGKFSQADSKIDDDALNTIFQLTLGHTYYVQAVCNKLFSRFSGIINKDHVLATFDTILKEQSPVFFQYRNLLTKAQWGLLIAVAKEERVKHPTSGAFIHKYNLGSPAAVRRGLESLLGKEMILETITHDEKMYRIYDVFFMRWLARTY